jgi:hypothetical protein
MELAHDSPSDSQIYERKTKVESGKKGQEERAALTSPHWEFTVTMGCLVATACGTDAALNKFVPVTRDFKVDERFFQTYVGGAILGDCSRLRDEDGGSSPASSSVSQEVI